MREIKINEKLWVSNPKRLNEVVVVEECYKNINGEGHLYFVKSTTFDDKYFIKSSDILGFIQEV